MTDLREAVARLVDPKLFDDHAPHPWPYLLDEERNAAISVAGDYLRAIEAAGYAVVPKVLTTEMDLAGIVAMARSIEDGRAPGLMTKDERYRLMAQLLVCNSTTLGDAWDAVLAASPPLAKET